MIQYKLVLKYLTSGLTAEIKLHPLDENFLQSYNLSYNITNSMELKTKIIKELVNFFIINDSSIDINKLYAGHMMQIFQAGCEISGYEWL
jgi:hypothetical protein